MAKRAPVLKQAGWKLRDFCPAARISPAQIYKFSPELQPRSVYIGRARIIVESPADWLARIGQAQRVAI